VRTTIPVGGTLSNLNVRVSGSVGTGSDAYTFTLVHNGSNSVITCNVTTAGTTCSDLDSLTVAAGDGLSLRADPVNSPTEPTFVWSVRIG
jgi:hypothetical protein